MLLSLALLGMVLPAGAKADASPSIGPIALGITTSSPLDPTALADYESATGAAPQIEMWFTDFGSSLYWSSTLQDVAATGAVPLITWDPYANGQVVPFSAIADGSYDSYIRAQAQLAASAHTLIYIRFAHEMNIQTSASPWGPGAADNTPATFIAAWRHVVTIFRDAGATNVKWVWAPNTDCDGSCPFDAYYPGDAWVDDLGLDGYNFAATHNVPWESFADIFRSSYDDLTALTDKPVMITETASVEQGGNKAAWITQAFLHDIPTLFPRIIAVIWWQRVDEADWRIDSSSSAASAWAQVAASPLYGADDTLAGRALGSDVSAGSSDETTGTSSSSATTSTATTTSSATTSTAATTTTSSRAATSSSPSSPRAGPVFSGAAASATSARAPVATTSPAGAPPSTEAGSGAATKQRASSSSASAARRRSTVHVSVSAEHLHPERVHGRGRANLGYTLTIRHAARFFRTIVLRVPRAVHRRGGARCSVRVADAHGHALGSRCSANACGIVLRLSKATRGARISLTILSRVHLRQARARAVARFVFALTLRERGGFRERVRFRIASA